MTTENDAAAREATPESAGLRAIKVSRQLPYDQLESSFIQKFQVFLEREFLAHAEQARAEEREWTRVTKEVEYGGPYLITNNPTARLNDGSMSHVWLARRIFKDGGEFCAFSDERCMQKVYGVTHYKPVSPPGAPDG